MKLSTVRSVHFNFDLAGQKVRKKILGVAVMAAPIIFTTLQSKSQEMNSESTEQWNTVTVRSESDSHFVYENWPDPPPEYANKSSVVWADPDAITRGRKIWTKHCQSCHGADGQGTGQNAESLSHLPADLSSSFHNAPGEGDAYLFWRVSEGGAAEPFKSMGSEMPAFKNLLNESKRWDVLSYVHAFFHKGLIHWALPD